MPEEAAAPIELFLKKNLDQYLSILKSWVAVNSFTANADGVNALGELTAETFLDLGFTTNRVPSVSETFGEHFVFTKKGSGQKTLGLVSHLDTVFPSDEEMENGFSWRVDGDRIYGPGTVDIKGGTMLIYMLLHALRELEPELFESITWKILLDASEETLSEDFGALCRSELGQAEACLVFEGGFYDDGVYKLVQSRKGMAKFKVRVEGKAAHAGVAHADGANAIVQISDVIRKIADFTDHERNITFNVGSVEGGTVPNRVPHYAQAVGEMRAFDSDIFDEGVANLKGLAEQATVSSLTGVPCKIIVDIYEVTAPWPQNEDTDRLIALWQEVAENLGSRLLPEARGGLSDGNHTWDFVPTLDGLGPGGGNAHCSVHNPEAGLEQEYLYLPSVVPKAVLNFLAVKRLLGS